MGDNHECSDILELCQIIEVSKPIDAISKVLALLERLEEKPFLG